MRVDELRRALEAAAADAPPARHDMHSTVRRGRRLLTTRRLAFSGIALAVLGGVIAVSIGVTDRRSVIVEPTPATAPTTTIQPTPSETTSPAPIFAGFITAAMRRTVEVDLPSEHFKSTGRVVSTAGGAGGTLRAVVGIRTPTADAKGQLVFFFHDRSFIGWDASQEAISVLGLELAGPRSFTVTYANYAANDALVGASLPPAVITYTWDGNRMTPDRTPPPGVYGLNDSGANAIRVRLTG
jgi:hypothetical protein